MQLRVSGLLRLLPKPRFAPDPRAAGFWLVLLQKWLLLVPFAPCPLGWQAGTPTPIQGGVILLSFLPRMAAAISQTMRRAL